MGELHDRNKERRGRAALLTKRATLGGRREDFHRGEDESMSITISPMRPGARSGVPYHAEAEMALLGCFVVEPRMFEEHGGKLTTDDFFLADCGRIFDVICALAREGSVIRLETLQPFLQEEDYGLLADAMRNALPLFIERDLATVKRDAARRRRLAELEAEKQRLLDGEADATLPGVGKSRLSFRRVSEIMAMTFDDSDRYLGDRMLGAGLNTVLAGPGGIGKSRLLIQMALCSITGRPFLGMPTYAKGKRWLIVQSENSVRRMQADIFAMIKSFCVTDEEVALIEDNLILHTIENDDDVYMRVEDPREAREIEAAIQDYRATFNVFDPLNTFTALDLNSDQGMREVCSRISQMVKRGDPSRVPLVLHHAITGKAGAAKAVGWDKSSFGRNSKVLQAWARSQFNLAPRDPDDNSLLLLSCGKCSEGREFAPMGLRYHHASGLYTVDPDFDLDQFKEEVQGETRRPDRCPVPKVVEILRRYQPLTRADLKRKIAAECGITTRAAHDKIERAETQGAVKMDRKTELYRAGE